LTKFNRKNKPQEGHSFGPRRPVYRSRKSSSSQLRKAEQNLMAFHLIGSAVLPKCRTQHQRVTQHCQPYSSNVHLSLHLLSTLQFTVA